MKSDFTCDDWDNLKELYQIRRGLHNDFFKSKQFAGTFMGAISALWEYILVVLAGFYDVKRWKIRDGYALVLLSPIILLWWIVLTILFIVCLVTPIPFAILSVIWLILFELPADVLNDSHGKWEKQEEEIRLIAHRIWESENCPFNRHFKHWKEAEEIWWQTHKLNIYSSQSALDKFIREHVGRNPVE